MITHVLKHILVYISTVIIAITAVGITAIADVRYVKHDTYKKDNAYKKIEMLEQKLFDVNLLIEQNQLFIDHSEHVDSARIYIKSTFELIRKQIRKEIKLTEST